MQKILVIKLSALGDIVLSTAAFAAIRQHHPHAHITLLTTQLYRDFVMQMGYFDAVLIDPRYKFRQWYKFFGLIKDLLGQNFTRVYDLQMVDRTNFYFYSFGRGTEWVGTTKGCAYYYRLPKNHQLHALERQQNLLSLVGIDKLGLPDLRHLTATPVRLPVPYALIIPGASAAKGGKKRWSSEGFLTIIRLVAQHNITPVLIGGPQEDNSALAKGCPGTIDLTGRTTFSEIVNIAAGASFALGNDTGPLHLAAAAHCPVVGLFSAVSKPEISGAISPTKTLHIFAEELALLQPQKVAQELQEHGFL